jgi:hypothetical protein
MHSSGGHVDPAQHWMKTHPRGSGGFAADFYGIYYHGVASTHIDALCHTWDDEGMWNGRDPEKEITFDGATFGGVPHWSDGLITRGVLLDAAGYRERRRVVLTEEAEIAAERALRNGEPVRLEPMSASERRMVHQFLKDRSDVETYSEGDEPERRLVITPLLAE